MAVSLFFSKLPCSFYIQPGPRLRDPADELESSQQGAASAETADKSLPPPEAPTEKKKKREPSAVSLPRHMRRGDGRKQPPVWMMYGVELGTGTWALNRRKAENERGEEGHA